MMRDGKQKSESEEHDPEKLGQILEIELQQKRADWRQAQARRGTLRALSFLFLAAVVGAALLAFFLFFNPERVREFKTAPAPMATPR